MAAFRRFFVAFYFVISNSHGRFFRAVLVSSFLLDEALGSCALSPVFPNSFWESKSSTLSLALPRLLSVSLLFLYWLCKRGNFSMAIAIVLFVASSPFCRGRSWNVIDEEGISNSLSRCRPWTFDISAVERIFSKLPVFLGFEVLPLNIETKSEVSHGNMLQVLCQNCNGFIYAASSGNWITESARSVTCCHTNRKISKIH